MTDVIRYAALWCPDFPIQTDLNQQATLLFCKSSYIDRIFYAICQVLFCAAHPGWNGMFELILKNSFGLVLVFFG
jgi:hypothetical protein